MQYVPRIDSEKQWLHCHAFQGKLFPDWTTWHFIAVVGSAGPIVSGVCALAGAPTIAADMITTTAAAKEFLALRNFSDCILRIRFSSLVERRPNGSAGLQ